MANRYSVLVQQENGLILPLHPENFEFVDHSYCYLPPIYDYKEFLERMSQTSLINSTVYLVSWPPVCFDKDELIGYEVDFNYGKRFSMSISSSSALRIRSTLLELGITYEELKKNGDLEHMLNRGRTHYFKRMQCKFSLEVDKFGIVSLKTHEKKSEIDFSKFMNLTEDDKRRIIQTGHLGHIYKSDDGYYYLSLDRELLELVAVPRDEIFIPSKLKNINLSFRQRKTLKSAGQIRIGNGNNQFLARVNATTHNIDLKKPFFDY